METIYSYLEEMGVDVVNEELSDEDIPEPSEATLEKGDSFDNLLIDDIDDDFSDEFSEKDIEEENIVKAIPLGKMGTPEDIAEAAAFLALSPYITGEVIRVDGGISM